MSVSVVGRSREFCWAPMRPRFACDMPGTLWYTLHEEIRRKRLGSDKSDNSRVYDPSDEMITPRSAVCLRGCARECWVSDGDGGALRARCYIE